ncbi:hypothetical protein [Roseomonas sp. 18066]|uniref:hypothetical protein n=1 Tax=Roseomonas sp. 18066 TaxID=2681412 RepID=UPI00135A62F1|nr:hypothetical protein [Roseomonas sp. 18066]
MKAAHADLKALDRVLALVSPSMAVAAEGRGRPSTTAEVAEQTLREKGLELDDPRLPGLIDRVSAAMNQWASKGKVARTGTADGGRGGLWEVAMLDAYPGQSDG